MKFPTRLTYALRMMVEISQGSTEDVPVRLSEISSITGISRSYLEQLAMLLKSRTLLQGVSGRKGGYRLAKPADEIKLIDVVKATIGPIQLTKCISNPSCCPRSDFCECNAIWQLINLQMTTVLEKYSLEDLSDEGQMKAVYSEIEHIRSGGSETGMHGKTEQQAPSSIEQSPDIHATRASSRHTSLSTGSLNRETRHKAHTHAHLPCNMKVEKVDFLETIRWLEEEIRVRIGNDRVSIPVDSKHARVVYTTNMREIKYMPFSLLAAAEIFHAAKEDWTMISEGWDSDELFRDFLEKNSSNDSNKKILFAARSLNANKIVVSECGHTIWPSKWATTQPSTLGMIIPVESFIHTLLNYVKSGRIRLDPSKNTEPVTYHDPCILGRHYGITEEPRYLLSKALSDFREMYPNRLENWCCRGGGGSSTEYNFRRNEMSRIKVDQILRTGAKIVATACPNCIDGLNELIGEYRLDVKVKSVSELISKALIHDQKQEKRQTSSSYP